MREARRRRDRGDRRHRYLRADACPLPTAWRSPMCTRRRRAIRTSRRSIATHWRAVARSDHRGRTAGRSCLQLRHLRPAPEFRNSRERRDRASTLPHAGGARCKRANGSPITSPAKRTAGIAPAAEERFRCHGAIRAAGPGDRAAARGPGARDRNRPARRRPTLKICCAAARTSCAACCRAATSAAAALP